MIRELQKKFTAAAMVSIVIVLSLIIGIINIINYRNVNKTADMRLNVIAENSGRFPRFDRDFVPNARMSPEAPFDTRYFTVRLDDKGEALGSETGKIAAVTDETAVEYAKELFEKGKTDGFKGIYKYRALDVNDGTMYIFLDCERELNNFRSFMIASIAVSVIGTALVFFLVALFSRAIVRPVAESYEKQKRFITDASHEIKTPLTIIDANTEVLEMENGESEWTQSIRNQIKRLSGLTEKLVFLSRMDEENTVLAMDSFPLSEAVIETAKAFETIAASRGQSMEIDVEENIYYYGNEETIRQLVSLLLDNAVKYSDNGGLIRVRLKSAGRNKRLTVWNTVENIEKGNLDILFERFYRSDPSRSSEISGYGIGLSAAKAIVTAHKGKISSVSEDGKSILFTVIL